MATNKTPQGGAVLPFTLRSIYVRNSSTRTDDHFDPLLPDQQLMAIFRTGEGRCDCREIKYTENDKDNVIRSCAFTTRFEFAYRRPTDGDQPISDEDIEKFIAAQITADITLDYLIKWAHENVILHAWPYWREFCHSTMLRMNLPVTMIPLVQLVQLVSDGNTANKEASTQKRSPRKTKAAAK
jgi:hypothetical protein